MGAIKLVLPDHLGDIPLWKYQQLMKLDADDKDYEDNVFTIFTGIKDIENVQKKDFDDVINHVKKACEQTGEFKRTFTIDGIDFGLIPNFDKITGTSNGGEYCDMINYFKNVEDGYNPTLDRFTAVVYRPISAKDKLGNYKIEPYNGTSGHIEQINKLPMSIVFGCLGFFLSLSNELESHIQACILEAQVRAQSH